MKARFQHAILLAAPFAALSFAALAEPRIQSVSAKPNPAGLPPAEVTITVSIDRPTPLDIAKCEVVVDPGDGAAPLRFVFDIGDRHTKNNKHTYRKAGTFTVKATGTGQRPCRGTREATMAVGAKAAPAKPGAAKPR